MLGYRIHFNGEKFVADNTATEVQTSHAIQLFHGWLTKNMQMRL